VKAYLKTEAYGYAIRDATKAIEIKKDFVKVRQPFQTSLQCCVTHLWPQLRQTL